MTEIDSLPIASSDLRFDEPILLKSLYDHGLWIFSKPAGWLSHPDGSERPDLMTWVKTHLDVPHTLTLIHRLDYGTSGLLCCSGNSELAAHWGKLWADGKIRKRYVALAEGKLHAQGVISRSLKDGRRGKPLKAKTRYKRLLELKGCTLLDIELEQGRKHQIRRHLQGIGSGVVGDLRYPPHRRTPLRGAPERLWLHAVSLTLPTGASSLTLTAPLTSDLYTHLELLSKPEDLDSLRIHLGLI